MTNKARGEVELTIGQQKFTLCLTLGALAEIEDKLGVEDVTQIGEKFEKPKASDFIALLVALAHGGGHEEVTEDTFKSLTIADMQEAMSDITKVFDAAEMGPSEGNPSAPADQ